MLNGRSWWNIFLFILNLLQQVMIHWNVLENVQFEDSCSNAYIPQLLNNRESLWTKKNCSNYGEPMLPIFQYTRNSNVILSFSRHRISGEQAWMYFLIPLLMWLNFIRFQGWIEETVSDSIWIDLCQSELNFWAPTKPWYIFGLFSSFPTSNSFLKTLFNFVIMQWKLAWWTNWQLWTDLFFIIYSVTSRI